MLQKTIVNMNGQFNMAKAVGIANLIRLCKNVKEESIKKRELIEPYASIFETPHKCSGCNDCQLDKPLISTFETFNKKIGVVYYVDDEKILSESLKKLNGCSVIVCSCEASDTYRKSIIDFGDENSYQIIFTSITNDNGGMPPGCNIIQFQAKRIVGLIEHLIQEDICN